MSIKAIRGFKDILPDETPVWRRIEEAAGQVARAFGYKEIRIPVVERTELFARSIGTDTDIVEKEMFTFPDRHGDPLTLRPEATAGIVRAAMENNLIEGGRPLKLYFLGPMFRYERPQKGRQRQFHQLDVETFNDPSPFMDAEIILWLVDFLRLLDLGSLSVHLNSLGCPACRPDYKTALKAYLQDVRDQLCPDCQRRLETNPLRVIDCKVERCAALVQDAPWTGDHLCAACRTHNDQVLRVVGGTAINTVSDHRLVRGLDYYTRTVFEVRSGDLGAQSAVAGGGRYDGLFATLGGPDIPGIGFAVGLERLAMLLTAQNADQAPGPELYVAALDDETIKRAFDLVLELRRLGLWVETDYQPGSLKSRLKRADKLRAAQVLILGPEELKNDRAILRNMKDKSQTEIPLTGAVRSLVHISRQGDTN